ncbi:flagellar export protein FliJ [Sideroxydans lithotrophicus]|uniref:Flagellar FliJ protein n=1 Tax=Sideroxydans lithotrophicus (strain ES-1) TaxID=580332 RepID=D5CMZ8_SIDLE|nr:flagellar export protein FliJ [Sideroxydans lithotrophicus]ADE10834.1 flagellar export protein FliJ [Sideroxydans lithotrophicus ES-1]
MIKPFSLQPLVHLAQQKNDAATKKLGQLNQQQQTAQQKLDALLQYRKDYQLKFQEAAKNGMAPADMKNFQDFIGRLDQAIQQQTAVAERAKAGVQNGRTELMDATRKMKSFDTLAQRHAEAEKKLEAKNEQRTQDEHTGRFAAYRSANKDDKQ